MGSPGQAIPRMEQEATLMSEKSLSAWTLRVKFLCSATKNPKKTLDNRLVSPTLKRSTHEGEGAGKSFLLYRKELLRLLAAEKGPHDDLLIELPCLMGFRNEETTTWQLEYINAQFETCMVLDAKKHELIPGIPVHRTVLKHVEEVREGRVSGYVVVNESPVWKGRLEPISTTAVWYVWRKWATRLRLYPSPEEYSPVVGRRLFIKEYLSANSEDFPEALITCSRMVRHSNPKITLDYADRITFDSDVKRNFDRFQKRMDENLVEVRSVG